MAARLLEWRKLKTQRKEHLFLRGNNADRVSVCGRAVITRIQDIEHKRNFNRANREAGNHRDRCPACEILAVQNRVP